MVADRVFILGADGQIVGGWKGLRSLRAHERRAALLAPDGLAQQAQLLAALGGVTHV
jgi:hypothetical protein